MVYALCDSHWTFTNSAWLLPLDAAWLQSALPTQSTMGAIWFPSTFGRLCGFSFLPQLGLAYGMFTSLCPGSSGLAFHYPHAGSLGVPESLFQAHPMNKINRNHLFFSFFASQFFSGFLEGSSGITQNALTICFSL